MALFTLLRLSFRQPSGHGLQQLFQQRTAILEKRMAQAQFDGLQIPDALLAPLLPDQSYEGLGFLEPFFVALGGFEAFFLLSPGEHSNWVI